MRSTIHIMLFEIEYYKTEKCYQDFNYLLFFIIYLYCLFISSNKSIKLCIKKILFSFIIKNQ